ncbi:MAG: TetR/AcrR family transcriptional regulator [Armatimonadetes bacterium]|nr:TetR/AcrR family transcriptional regulator [Anaerolineae bacterium]
MTIKQDAIHTRTRLVDAAIQMMLEDGAKLITLDAVAKRAGVSKGGLLHYFPSKEALIDAILRHLFAEFTIQVERYLALEPERAGRWARAYIRATFEPAPPPMELALLLFPLIESEALLSLFRQDTMQWHERLWHDGLPRARALIIQQAADAYWLNRTLHITEEDVVLHEAVLHELLTLTEVV